MISRYALAHNNYNAEGFSTLVFIIVGNLGTVQGRGRENKEVSRGRESWEGGQGEGEWEGGTRGGRVGRGTAGGRVGRGDKGWESGEHLSCFSCDSYFVF